jgi:HK97 family phage prohead protease
MAEMFSPPKAVRAEGLVTEPVDAAGLLAVRGATGETGAWASRVADNLTARAAEILKENVVTETRADMPYGVETDPVSHGIMAADAALDAAQNLLAGNLDPVVNQAYYLICAADAALDEAQEALGLVDADDNMSEPVEPVDPMAGDMTGMMDMTAPRSESLMLAEHRNRLATAEQITFDAEIRAAADGSMRISGYAAKFNTEASALGFREQIAPGAFKRSLAGADPIYLLVNHDTEQLPLASTGSGTLQLREDAIGLLMTADLDKSNPRAAELYSALKRGDVSKMSFMFTIADGGETRENGLRTLTDLNLFEVSVVTWPAYDSTEVGVRDAANNDLSTRARLAAARLALIK